ncbi:MAG: TonB-dependent receptor [Sphingomonadales bacterium]|nr:TonB-dependent receptor [Sphingomonadales bacterium]
MYKTPALKKLQILLLPIFLSPAFSGFAFAEDSENDDSNQHNHMEELIVTATPIGRSQFDIVQSTAVLSGDELVAEIGGNIGETLDHIPGIANSFFGPGAGRPIVRGLGGDRVRVLVGGIGSIDASSTSPDHAVAGDPLSAQSIEIIRGPATLLYGNNALGGVINLIDGRIPFRKIDAPIEGAIRAIAGSNADELNLSGAVDIGVGENIVLHFEGSNREAKNMTIPGFARTAALRTSDPLTIPANEVENSVPNSHLTSSNYSAGGTLFTDNGYIGFSVGKLANNYGIPVTFEEGAEDVRINLDQTRVDVMAEMNKEFLFFEKAKFRFGWADYEHIEFEGAEVGTTFLNTGWEGRLELVQKGVSLSNDWMMDGAMGVQMKKRNFEAIGDEAFVPPSSTTQVGLFVMEEWGNAKTSFQLGSRIEFQDVSAPSINMDKSFTGLSFSGGFSYLLNHEILFGITAHRTERNPNAEELFSNGPHIATQTYEIGNAALLKERATGGEVTLRKREGSVTGSISLFVNSFDNFIYEDFTDEVMDELPVARFAQTDAQFYGGEVEVNWLAWQDQNYSLTFDIGADMVRAKEKGTNLALPRIPPHSLTLAAALESEKYILRLEGEWAGEQNRIDVRETVTDGYFRLDSSFTYHPYGDEKDVSLIFQVRNITNAEIRYHTSFLKDMLPAPGRDLRILLRVGF